MCHITTPGASWTSMGAKKKDEQPLEFQPDKNYNYTYCRDPLGNESRALRDPRLPPSWLARGPKQPMATQIRCRCLLPTCRSHPGRIRSPSPSFLLAYPWLISSSGSRMPSIRQRVRPRDRIPSRGSIVGFGCFLPRRAPSPYTNYLSLLPKTAKRTNQREGEWSSRGILYASCRRSKGLSCYPHRPKAPVSNFARPGLQLYVGRSRLYGVLGRVR